MNKLTHSPSLKGKLKIAMICDWYLPRIGGIEFQLRDLALQLMSEGHEVQIITSTPGESNTEGVLVHRLNTPRIPGLGLVWTPSAFKKIQSILTREQFDVVHCHTSVVTPLSYGGAYVSQKMGFPTVLTCHSILRNFTKVLGALDKPFKWSKWPVLFSAVSGVAAKDVKSLVNEHTVHILPNGIEHSEWKLPESCRSKKEVSIVTVLRLNQKKRAKALLRMIPEVLKALSPDTRVRFKIIGDGPQRSDLEKMVDRMSLRNVVELMGYQSKETIKKVFSDSDIFVLPTILESFSIAAYEARCAGLPIIAMQRSGVSEYIQCGREGILAGNDTEMANSIVQLIENHDLRSAIAKHNRETLPPVHWDDVIKKHMEIYNLALEKRGVTVPVKPSLLVA